MNYHVKLTGSIFMSSNNFIKIIKKDFEKNLMKDIKIFLKSTKNMKNKSLLSVEKNIIKGEKTHYYNYKKLFRKYRVRKLF